MGVVLTTIPKQYITPETKYHINPCGAFIIGGPMADAGLTGRKIIVDTYGGWGAHGGGAFSGKDYTKVDRSAAYAARWVAKSLVKAGLCRRCLVQVAYAIGVAEPLSITVMDYGTSNKSQQELTEIVKKNFDLRPGKIVKDLNLKAPIFQSTSTYGHFVRPPISPYLFLGAWHQFWLFLTKILTDLANFDQPRPVLKKIKTKLFKLRKVNHTLGDHRSGRAWDSNHGPNETDGRHL